MSDFPQGADWVKGEDDLWRPPEEPGYDQSAEAAMTDEQRVAAVKASDRKAWMVILGTLGVMVVLIVLLTLDGADGSSGSDRAPSGEVAELSAFNACKDFVRDRLKAPSTATFRNFFQDDGEVRVSYDGSTYTVRSTVDSENSFGASLRSSFTCVVTMTGTTIRLVDLDLS